MAITKIGIRQLVEFILRTGDLNDQSNSQNTAAEGARIHRKLQRSRSDNYEKEYYLEHKFKIEDQWYEIDGRADGVIIEDDQLWIEEIKTSDPAFDELSTNKITLYWAQAKVYGAILTQQLDYDEAKIQLTYYQRPTKDVHTEEQTFTKTALDDFFQDLINQYIEWLRLRTDWRKVRNQSIKQLNFPFPEYRNGQRELAVAVYKTILTQQRLFVEAPTGTGKTISTLFPVIKALGEGVIDRTFYLTAKQSTQHVAEDAINLMTPQGLQIKSITITAKEKITFPEVADVKPENNPYMVGYYDRIKDGIKDILKSENQLTKEIIQGYAKKHMLDPFEYSLDLSLFCDVIIGDFNYLFDPVVYLQRFFSVKDPDNFFLIDEAHNLVSRSRDMYSAEFSEGAALQTQQLVNDADSEVADLRQVKRRLTQIINELTLIRTEFNQRQERGSVVTSTPLDQLEKAFLNFSEVVREWLPKQPDSELTTSLLNLMFAASKYTKISEFYDESYRVLITKDAEDNLMIKEQILDPSPYLDESLSNGRGAVFFSATMSPVNYYQETLGSKEGLVMRLNSPFEVKQQNILITNYVNTKYAERQANLPKIVESIAALVSAKTGNYLIFCPSYSFMTDIADNFSQQYPATQIVTQQQQMSPEERQIFLDNFAEPNQQTLVGFAVLGGLFSEGIDLTEDQLIGVGIVSVGLPGLSEERKMLQDYFDQKNGHGFEYAYQLPGMNHVLQAAGRLIRTRRDKGNVLLIDQRFGTNRYTNLFPSHWQHYRRLRDVTQLKKTLAEFWEA